MAGTRGTHDDSDGAGWPDKNMPAPKPKHQGDTTGSDRGGTHPSDFSGNSTATPRPLGGATDDETQAGTKGTGAGNIVFGDHETRRSHS